MSIEPLTAASPTAGAGLTVGPGRPLPYGARRVPGGISFSVPSNGAGAVTLVLFRPGAELPFAELPFPERYRVGGVYAMTVLGLDPDAVEYGYRAAGPAGAAGAGRFDPTRILADPYARALGGREEWGTPNRQGRLYPYRAQVPDTAFDWEDDRPPRLAPADLVVYEAHVRGFTRHPSSGVRAPGTFAGLTEKIPYLRELGVNCLELLPVFEFDESDNVRSDPRAGRPLYNYWGYSTVGFFAPKASYASGEAVRELKELVKQLHRSGIELVLDVVFNHTAEGDERGPTISFRGLDDSAYYMLTPEGGYRNLSGTGNTFNANDPLARAFVLDCLRYWVTEYHVDGFRFDLASVLVRAPDGTPLENPPLLEAIAADPVLRDTKLIAEAWDAAGLYQVGSFPDQRGRWAEWNGRYRDTVRRFLKGDEGAAGELADRMLGSPDLYPRRGPLASVNFVTAHDGFTLHDLVSYNEKHNEANGEGNRDGESVNHSWNCGREGPTDDPEVLALRSRQVRNALLLLLTGHGVPMLSAGDESGRTLHGNNNAYCHDELSWIDWESAERNAELTRFVRQLIAFRRAHPALRRARHATSVEATRDGVRPGEPDRSEGNRLLALTLREGTDVVHLAANAHWEPVELRLPEPPEGSRWARFADTSAAAPYDVCVPGEEQPLADQRRITVGPRSAGLLVAIPVTDGPATDGPVTDLPATDLPTTDRQ
ncbi:alpha-amylase family glycosyl hydrolase [Kitasatospora sp. NPDC005856]|uniref:glycogen debranching protein n=1 Tax=Kitasatospora sp. NPDC005856 TaxID=3154566 RepID=UPI0033DF8CAA